MKHGDPVWWQAGGIRCEGVVLVVSEDGERVMVGPHLETSMTWTMASEKVRPVPFEDAGVEA